MFSKFARSLFCRLVFKMDPLGLEILRIAFPAAMALAADPIASLIDTAFIGHIGTHLSSKLFLVNLTLYIFQLLANKCHL